MRVPPLHAAVIGALTVSLALLPAATAQAHVRVTADSTAPGGFSQLTFRVPNESDTAHTVKLAVQLPQDHPFLHVSTRQLPGWTATVAQANLPSPVMVDGTTITRAARTVTWTPTGDGIKAGQYQEFAISVGPLPDSGQILLPTTQTYSDGTVVAWDQPTPASGEEPERPAPAFTIGAASDTGTNKTTEIAASATTGTPSAAVAAARRQADNDHVAVGTWLGGVALVVALIGLALGLVRRREATA